MSAHEPIYAATRGRKWGDVAAELGCSTGAVNNAVSAHLRAVREAEEAQA